jgi:hypothetical protein
LTVKYTIPQVRKTVVAFLGAFVLIVTAVSSQFATVLPASWAGGITIAVAAATALGVFLTKNAPVIDALDDPGR